VEAAADVVILEVPARRDHLALVRQVVTGAAAIAHRVDPHRLEDLRLAVSEACANAIDSQERTGSDRPLRITIEADDEVFTVTVTDHGGGFVPDDLASLPTVTDPRRLRHERGLGVQLMRSLVDEVRFTSADGGTAVRLGISLPPRV
jgi:serine/threonine-protein kinase RsbW